MISQANIEWISKVSGVTTEEISGALSNEQEVSLDLKLNGRVISQEDERLLKESGVQQGKELASKDLAKNQRGNQVFPYNHLRNRAFLMIDPSSLNFIPHDLL